MPKWSNLYHFFISPVLWSIVVCLHSVCVSNKTLSGKCPLTFNFLRGVLIPRIGRAQAGWQQVSSWKILGGLSASSDGISYHATGCSNLEVIFNWGMSEVFEEQNWLDLNAPRSVEFRSLKRGRYSSKMSFVVVVRHSLQRRHTLYSYDHVYQAHPYDQASLTPAGHLPGKVLTWVLLNL